MGQLYHGSSTKGIKELTPHESTHGNYVYATQYKELAIIFSKRSGNDLTYSLYRYNKDEPWKLVERIPGAFDVMFSNSSTLYTVSDETFKDIKTGFSELVSEVAVNTTSETQINNVFEAIKELEKKGKVEIYRYPNRPKDMIEDNSDLIEKEVRQSKRNNKVLTKDDFERMLLLHPNLIDKINNVLLENNQEIFKEEEIVEIFELFLVKQMLEPDKEQFISSSVIQIATYFPGLMPNIQEKLNILNMSQKDKIEFILDTLSKDLKDFPKEFIDQAKNKYISDNRSFTEICNEINNIYRKIKEVEKYISKDIDENILENSILLIGPMCTGKSTISSKLSNELNLNKISLDNRNQLSNIYKDEDKLSSFKEFEFYLTSNILTNLESPSVIDFGAGHSVYENPIMFYEFKKLITKFKNIIYILPTEDKDESIKILNGRIIDRNPDDIEHVMNDNKHFISMPCNDQIATIKVYTKNKSIDEIATEIINKIKINKNRNKTI